MVFEGNASEPMNVTSGVAQGTVLGPLLFLTYKSDLLDLLSSSVRLFADDALLYGVITDQFGCDVLQDDLYKLELWQENWQMKFNPSKCKVLYISNKKDPHMRNYEFCGSTLEQIQYVSYLPITINDKMKWSEHISNVTSKANKTLGMAKRNFWNCPKNVKEAVHSTIIRPRLEYAHIVWIHILKKT